MIELVKIGKEQEMAARESLMIRFLKKQKKSGVLLQTCNRVEWYHGEGEIPNDIIVHLFRLVSGLESTIVGETAIVGQVKRAYCEAVKDCVLHKNLHRLFQTALFVGKRVRSETGISKGAMSYSQAVVQILQKEFEDLGKLRFAFVGVNKLNEDIIRYLKGKGCVSIFIGNRTYGKAQELADKYASTALQMDKLQIVLQEVDVLVSATSAPHLIIKKENISVDKSICIFDLAVPRDIDPDIGGLSNVRLFNIENIESRIVSNIRYRKDKMKQAEKIIEEEVQIFKNKLANEQQHK